MASRFRARLGERLTQTRLAYTTTRANDPRLLVWMVGAAVVALPLPLVPLVLIGRPWVGLVAGIFLALAATIVVLGLRSQRVAIARIAGRPGAALAVLQSLRGAWKITPTVAFSGKQDLIHRVVGRPGVILIGEGRKARVQALLRQESRRTARVAGDIPVHEVNVGTGPGQVELGDLRMYVMRLPRAIKPREIGPLDRRLHALGGAELPIPKGPMPHVRRPR